MRPPRRRLLAGLLRASLTATVLVLLYFWLPFTGVVEASTVVLLAVGLALFAALVTWQVRAILRSRYPALRAIEALAAAIPLFLLLFAVAYVTLDELQARAFSEPLTRVDALYYTITVFSTVGFGDITPVVTPARVTTMIQMLLDLVVVGLVLRVLLDAVREGRARRAAEPPESSNRGDGSPAPPPYLAKQDGPAT